MESNLSYLFAGYASIWIILFAYLLRLGKRGDQLHRELELLRHQLNEKEGTGNPD